MASRFIRIYKKLEINEIKKHLLIYGDLSGSCANCQAMDIKLDVANCPQCHTEFDFIAFRNITQHFPKIQKLSQDRPQVTFVDHEDFKRILAAVKAEEFLK